MLTQDYSPFEVSFARAFINFLVCFVAAHIQGIRLIQRPTNWRLILRSLGGCSSLIFYFISLHKLKLADAVVINSSSPLFIALYQAIWHRKIPAWQVIVLIPMALLGVGLILKPELGFLNASGLWGLAGAASAGVAFIALHGIARQYHPTVIVGYFTGIASLVFLPWAPSFKVPSSGTHWALFLALGLSAAVAQSAMTRGYAFLDAITAAQLGNLNVIFSALIGAAILHEFPRWNFYLGTLLVVASCVMLLRKSAPKTRAEAEALKGE